ncbi:MAG: PD-(D/E)XK nuclease family protein [Methanospirillaceae archaeon]|nr:PD-(D/E)XK nuclease family protein [Methanospirillaceae archaeon]
MSDQKTFSDFSYSKTEPSGSDSFQSFPPGDLLIVPTSLLANQFKTQYTVKNIVFNPDHITTLSLFCRYYHDQRGKETRIITQGQTYSVMASALERIRDSVPFFFSRDRLSPGTVQDLFALRAILSQRCIDLTSHPLVATSEKISQINHALVAYHEACTENRFLDPHALVEWTINDLTRRSGCIFQKVRVYQLHDIYPREQHLILAIRNHAETFSYEYVRGKDPVIFSPPDWLAPEDLTALEPSQEYEDRSFIFVSSVTEIGKESTDDHSKAGVFSTLTDEMQSIAQEITVLAREGTNLSDIAITYPNIASVLPRLREVLDDFGIPCYAYIGEPLICEPVIGFLLLFPTLVSEGYPLNRVIELLQNPYTRISQPDLPPMDTAFFDLIARRAGIEGGYFWVDTLTSFSHYQKDPGNHDPPLPDARIKAVIAWIQQIQNDCNKFTGNLTAAGYSDLFHGIIEKWMRQEYLRKNDKKQDPVFLREKQAVSLFFEILTGLSSMVLQDESISLSSYLRSLLYLLGEPVSLTEDHGGVRILGLRQTLGMNYSCLFLGGLTEGDMPNPSTRFPLLTSEESEQLGARSLFEVVREEQYYFVSALAAGERIWLSASKTSKERNILSSSFFERVKNSINPVPWGGDTNHSCREASIRAGTMIRAQFSGHDISCNEVLSWLPADQTYGSVATRILVEDWFRTGDFDSVYDGILTGDQEVIEWLSGRNMFGSGRVWSATQLETYLTCPFRFFLDRVVRIKPFPDSDPTLSPAEKGTLVHDTLCAFYSQWCSNGPRRITNLNKEEAMVLLVQVAQKMSGRYRYTSPLWYATLASLFGFEDIPGLYERFILHEAESMSTLVPEKFECSLAHTIAASGERDGYVVLDGGDGEPLLLQGRIDRIDTDNRGYFAIIDYKTGSRYPNKKAITEGKALQLPLYLLAIETMYENDKIPRTGIAGSYLEISSTIKQTWPLLDPDKKQEAGVGGSKGNIPIREVTRNAVTVSQECIRGIRAGRFPVSRERCSIVRYCPYVGICRFDRFRAEDLNEGGDQ